MGKAEGKVVKSGKKSSYLGKKRIFFPFNFISIIIVLKDRKAEEKGVTKNKIRKGQLYVRND